MNSWHSGCGCFQINPTCLQLIKKKIIRIDFMFLMAVLLFPPPSAGNHHWNWQILYCSVRPGSKFRAVCHVRFAAIQSFGILCVLFFSVMLLSTVNVTRNTLKRELKVEFSRLSFPIHSLNPMKYEAHIDSPSPSWTENKIIWVLGISQW